MECLSAEIVQAYLEGKATPEERGAIDRHLQTCPGCRDVVALAPPSDPSAPLPVQALARGTRVERFVVDGVLGMGAMGVVYAARDPELDRPVALKLLRQESDARRERLAREAQALARVADVNVCAVYDIGTHDGRLFIAMELVDGDTLRDWMRRQRRSWRDVAAVFSAAARGLAAAHGAGVIHRDFKPDNVLVGHDGRVRVTDFGLAAWLPETEPAVSSPSKAGLTETGTVLGTPLYMAPEQHAGAPADERTDQWSFAIALYEALYGQFPFAGHDETELAREKAAGEVRPAPAAARVPRWLDRLVRRGLRPDPEDRWPSMAGLAAALEQPRPRRALTWALSAAFVAAVVASGAILLRGRDSGMEAARLAALAEQMEQGLRIEHMAPPHDLRPALNKVRAEVRKLEVEEKRGGGAVSYALGKGLQLLGNDESARTAYQRAWDAGFRTSGVADGLSTVLSALHQKAYRQAHASLAGPALEERLATLQSELAEPAMTYLAAGGNEPWRAALRRADSALLEQRFPVARVFAAEAFVADPGRYEALALQAEAWRSEAVLQHGDRLGQREPLARALEAADSAALWARSDQRVALLRIDIRAAMLAGQTDVGADAEAGLSSLLAAIDEAAALNPDEPLVLLSRGRVLRQLAQRVHQRDAKASVKYAEEALRVLRKAVELDGGEVPTLIELAEMLNKHARHYAASGDPATALPFVEEGLRALDRAAAREPRDPAIFECARKLHDTKGWARGISKPSDLFEEFRRAVAAGEEAIRLGIPNRAATQVEIAGELVRLSQDDWENGRDPRPDAQKGLALIEAAKEQFGHELWFAGTFVIAAGNVAEVALLVGDDPKKELAEARAMVDEVLARQPELALFEQDKGWIDLKEARREMAAGEDPSATLADAERALLSSVAKSGEDQGRYALAAAAFLVARWQALQGRDPSAALRKTQARIADLTRGNAALGIDLVAACDLEAARWARRRGQSSIGDARRGLEALEKAMGVESRDPTAWVEKAGLEALAGDGAQAKASLEHAAALNALVQRAPEWKEAAALVTP